MKKTVLASLMALSFLPAVPAFAQVKISGKVDVNLQNYKVGNVTQDDKMKSQNTYLEFSSQERLTNDFIKSVGAKLRMPVDITDGTAEAKDGTSMKKATLWANTRLGHVWAGKDNLPYLYMSNRYDTFGPENYASINSILGQNSYSLRDSNQEYKNSLGYISPKWHGVRVHAAHSQGDEVVDKANSVGAQYIAKDGRYSLFGTYMEQSFNGKVQDKEQGLKLGGMYAIGSIDVGAVYENLKTDMISTENERDAYSMFVSKNFGVHNVNLTYTQAQDSKTGGRSIDDGASQVTVGYIYPFSKRTKLYANATILENDAGGNYTLNNSDVKQMGAKHKLYAVGVSHSF